MFKFTVTARQNVAERDLSWQMVRESVRWFGARSPRVPVDVGTVSSPICDQLHRQHLSLAAEIQEVQAEIARIDWSEPFAARHEATSLARGARALQIQVRTVESSQMANGRARAAHG